MPCPASVIAGQAPLALQNDTFISRVQSSSVVSLYQRCGPSVKVFCGGPAQPPCCADYRGCARELPAYRSVSGAACKRGQQKAVKKPGEEQFEDGDQGGELCQPA